MGIKQWMVNVKNLVSPWRVCLFLPLFVLFACSQPRPSAESDSSVTDSLVQMAKPSRADEVLLHYWDGYDFHDQANISDPEKGEQSLVNFINLFPKVDLQTASLAVKHMLAAAAKAPKAYDFFIEQYDRYLYDPNSPMRNDLYYEPVLEFKLDSTALTADKKIRVQTVLALVRKNKVGSPAADFSYQLSTGVSGRLSTLSAPLTVLFFYEPGCSHCEDAIDILRHNAPINARIQQQELVFLAVYPFGGKDTWTGYQPEIPTNWLNAFDGKEEVLKGGKYDLKATPTIFLLDENKNVILKDVDVRVLIEYLR